MLRQSGSNSKPKRPSSVTYVRQNSTSLQRRNSTQYAPQSPYSNSPGRTSPAPRTRPNLVHTTNYIGSQSCGPTAIHHPTRLANVRNHTTVRSSSAIILNRRNSFQNPSTSNRITNLSNSMQERDYSSDRANALSNSHSTSSMISVNQSITKLPSNPLMIRIRKFHKSSDCARIWLFVKTFADIFIYSKSRAVTPKSSSCGNLRIKNSKKRSLEEIIEDLKNSIALGSEALQKDEELLKELESALKRGGEEKQRMYIQVCQELAFKGAIISRLSSFFTVLRNLSNGNVRRNMSTVEIASEFTAFTIHKATVVGSSVGLPGLSILAGVVGLSGCCANIILTKVLDLRTISIANKVEQLYENPQNYHNGRWNQRINRLTSLIADDVYNMFKDVLKTFDDNSIVELGNNIAILISNWAILMDLDTITSIDDNDRLHETAMKLVQGIFQAPNIFTLACSPTSNILDAIKNPIVTSFGDKINVWNVIRFMGIKSNGKKYVPIIRDSAGKDDFSFFWWFKKRGQYDYYLNGDDLVLLPGTENGTFHIESSYHNQMVKYYDLDMLDIQEDNQKVKIFVNNQLRWKSTSDINKVQEFIKNNLPDIPGVEISSIRNTLKSHYSLVNHVMKEMQILIKQ